MGFDLVLTLLELSQLFQESVEYFLYLDVCSF